MSMQAVAPPGFVLQRVRHEPGGQAVTNELRRPAQRLARCLVFEGGDELLSEAQTWISRKHIGTQVWRNILSMPTRDVHARRELEEIALGICRNVHHIPHVPHNDLGSATAALSGPPGCCTKDPRHMTARLLEREGLIIELLHQGEVVEHG